MGERENLQRDSELLEEVASRIRVTLSMITTAGDEQNFEAMERLTSSLAHQCSAYRHLRELDV